MTDRFGGYESTEELRSILARLKAKGFRAFDDVSGACSSDEQGHFHEPYIKVRLTAEQARKLAHA